MYSLVSVKFSWPDEGTKVLIAVPENGSFACYEGVVADTGPIMRITFDSATVVADDRGVPQIETFIDSAYRTNDDRGNGWCVDDDGDEAAAFRAATAMMKDEGVSLYECTSCGAHVGAGVPSSQQPGQGICNPTLNTPHLWKQIA